MAHTEKPDDGWTGSARRPWMNPPMQYHLGHGGRAWHFAMTVTVLAVAAAIAVLVLVAQHVLDERWVYVVIPIGITAAALELALGIFRASSESRRPQGR